MKRGELGNAGEPGGYAHFPAPHVHGVKQFRVRVSSAVVALVAGMSVVIVAGGASPATASGAVQQAAESAALIAALPRLQCPTDTLPLTPASAHLTAHGAAVYHYAMKTGPGFNYYVPPSRFKPLNASNSILAEMNLPSRPSGGSRLAAWKKDMGSYKGTDSNGAVATHYGSQYWSGYVDIVGNYSEVAAHWTQEQAFACGCSGPTDQVTWVGIGGVYDPGLIQDGTRNYSSTNPYAWFEYLGTVNVGIMQRLNTTVGDNIAAAVSYSNGTATFGVTDNGVYKVNTSVGGLAGDYGPRTAEFIVERPPSCKTCFPPLTNTDITFWTHARTFSPAGQVGVGSQSLYAVVMTSDGSAQLPPCSTSSKILEYPENLSDSNFDSVWCRAS